MMSDRGFRATAVRLLTLPILALFATLSACGGGGGSASTTTTTGGGSSSPSGTSSSPSSSPMPTDGTDGTTYKNDVLRTLPVDGNVDAQPPYLSKLTVAGASHNVVFIATESNSVYAIDADTDASLWQVQWRRLWELVREDLRQRGRAGGGRLLCLEEWRRRFGQWPGPVWCGQ